MRTKKSGRRLTSARRADAPQPAGLWTMRQAWEWLGVSRAMFYTLPIRRIRIGRAVRIDPKDLELYVNLHADRPALRPR